MNLSTLRDQTAKFCSDPDRTRFGDSAYLTALNLAQEQFALDTRSLWKDTTWTSTAEDATYAFSAASPVATDFMWEDTIYYDGKLLTPTSRRDFAVLSPGVDWTVETGTPTRVLVDPEEAVKGIRLYPIPTESGKTIAMRYFPLPTALADDEDTPLNSSALMAQFHIGLCAYAAWLLLLGETATPEIRQKRSDLLSVYSDAATKANDLFKNTVSAPWRMRGSRPV